MTTKNKEEQLAYLKNLKDEDIDYSDDVGITQNEINLIRPNQLFYKAIKKKISFTLDMDIVSWLQKHKNTSRFLNELLKKEILKHI